MSRIIAERNDEYKENIFTLKCIRVAAAVALGSGLLNVLGVFIIDKYIMGTAVIGAVIFLGISHLVGFAIGMERVYTKYILLFFLIAMLTFFGTVLSYHTTMFMLFPMIYSITYHSKRVTMYIYVLTCIGFLVSVFVGFRVGICDANMLLLTTGKTEMYIQKLREGNLSINTGYFVLFLYYVFPRCLILTALIPLQNYITGEMQKKTAREIEARRMVEIDGLTDLYNRNKYLTMIKDYYPKCKSIAVIYCDLNNLKVTNDTRGHENGDLLIISMAKLLKKFNSEQCLTYRIGGDEFVTIIENPMPGQAEQLAEKIRKETAKTEVEQGILLSAAVGFSQGSCKNVEEVINAADEQMYAQKAFMKNETV